MEIDVPQDAGLRRRRGCRGRLRGFPPKSPSISRTSRRASLTARSASAGNALVVLGTAADGAPARALPGRRGRRLSRSPAMPPGASRATPRTPARSARTTFSSMCGTRKIQAQIIDSANVRVDMGMPLSGEKTAEIQGEPPRILHARHPRPGPLGHLHAHLAGPLLRHDLRAGFLVSRPQDGAGDRGAAGLPGRNRNRLRAGLLAGRAAAASLGGPGRAAHGRVRVRLARPLLPPS